MIIIGAKGHAKEIFDILNPENYSSLFFFDNVSNDISDDLYGFPILKNLELVEKKLIDNPDFILGLGGVKHRHTLYNTFVNLKGNPITIIAENAQISKSSKLGKGLNIMSFTSVNADARIGNGTLINSYSSVHHDCIIGEFVEISPGARVLGNCTIGDFTTIGANATILPKVVIGSNVIVAAGAVVTKNVPSNCMVAGVPAIIKKQLPS
ncbi:acetyltransferase [Flavobacterium sp.]|uniref:acetyltransferase n=1 Tax=Flavobacterium sp. TaxID=239 RepID=UPI0038FC62F5